MPVGVAFALFAYLLYSCCDAIVKGLGAGLTVYQIAFWTALFSVIPALFTKPKQERWRQSFQTSFPLLVNMRAITGVLGNIAIIYAFTHIPLAEAYSLAFLAPIFVVALSANFLGERVTAQRWLFLALSFAGVVLVVRPGFRELELGHLAAVFAAMMGGFTTTVLRKIAPHEKRVSLIAIPIAYIALFNGLMMAISGFNWPSMEQFALLLTIGALGGTGNILFIQATRMTPASQLAPGQYSQIFWAVIFGALFYSEYPDLMTYVGLVVVVTGGILNVMSDEARIRIFSRLSVFGPASAAAEVSPPIEDKVADEKREPTGVVHGK